MVAYEAMNKAGGSGDEQHNAASRVSRERRSAKVPFEISRHETFIASWRRRVSSSLRGDQALGFAKRDLGGAILACRNDCHGIYWAGGPRLLRRFRAVKLFGRSERTNLQPPRP